MHSTITISNGDLKCNATTRDNQTLMYIEKPKKCITIIELDRCIRWQWASVRLRVFVTNQYFCFFYAKMIMITNVIDNKRENKHINMSVQNYILSDFRKSPFEWEVARKVRCPLLLWPMPNANPIQCFKMKYILPTSRLNTSTGPNANWVRFWNELLMLQYSRNSRIRSGTRWEKRTALRFDI